MDMVTKLFLRLVAALLGAFDRASVLWRRLAKGWKRWTRS
jgi:hypothetical protein